MFIRTVVAVLLVVSLSAFVNQVRGVSSTPVKFQTVLDPKANGCLDPQIDTERSGVYQLDDGRFGVLVIFNCL